MFILLIFISFEQNSVLQRYFFVSKITTPRQDFNAQTMIKDRKKALRRHIKGCIAAVSPESLKLRSAPLAERVEVLESYRKAHTVALYWSLPGEVDTHALVQRAVADKRVVLPVVTGESMHFAVVTPDLSNLVEGAFGVMEPRVGEVCPPSEVDFMLVPGVAFDARGHRLGHGKGYYDRYFDIYKGVKVGICFAFQMVDEVPCEPFDVAVDAVVSE